MSNFRQGSIPEPLVRFWTLDHYDSDPILWPVSPWPKLVFATKGVLQVQMEQTLHLIPSNRALFVRAGVPHPACTLGKAQVRTLYFSPKLSVSRPQNVLVVRSLFRELITEACRVGPLVSGQAVHQALADLLLSEVNSAPSVPNSIPMPKTDWVLDYADRYLEDPRNAAVPNYSIRTLERRFEAETGLTLGKWRQQARLLVGLRELALGATVLDAGFTAGFETTSGFIQSFKSQIGVTPARYTKQQE